MKIRQNFCIFVFLCPEYSWGFEVLSLEYTFMDKGNNQVLDLIYNPYLDCQENNRIQIIIN